jgi:hypothetical protein
MLPKNRRPKAAGIIISQAVLIKMALNPMNAMTQHRNMGSELLLSIGPP